jgi:hypothetical protein
LHPAGGHASDAALLEALIESATAATLEEMGDRGGASPPPGDVARLGDGTSSAAFRSAFRAIAG